VPTLKQLLDPKRRIARYALIADPNDPSDFDQVEVGWKVIEAPAGQGNGGSDRRGPSRAGGGTERRPCALPVSWARAAARRA